MDLQDALSRRLGPVTAAAGISVAGSRTVAGADGSFRIASLTKVLTSAALVLTLRDRGIPLDTPAIELLPGLADDWRADRSLTVEQLLGQVSGLRESVDAATVAALGAGDQALSEAARLVVRAGNERPPGTRWSYYNGNYFLAGAMLHPYEESLHNRVIRPWQLTRTGFAEPPGPVAGRNGDDAVPPIDYPRGRRPSGGLWSCVPDLLTVGERLIGDGEFRRARTTGDDPMAYGLGWALGPAGQMFLNGRLPGYRAAMLMVPAHEYVSVVLTADENALPAAARLLSDLQLPLTGQDIAAGIDRFAA
ncbi:serine hydrolase domain-containing protein [Actinoplanes sp. CA-030573]|uniref:serine hydrolase domain-containing protein n=1 Tax=Actinoplanes sp. CA-030573 TaxID=3239898 RepID=UPI003D932EEA